MTIPFLFGLPIESPFGHLVESQLGVRETGGETGGYMMGGDLEAYYYHWNAIPPSGAPQNRWNIAPYPHYRTGRNDRYDHVDDAWATRADMPLALCSGMWNSGPGPVAGYYYGNNQTFTVAGGIHVAHGVEIGMYQGMYIDYIPEDGAHGSAPEPPEDLPMPWTWADWPAGYEYVDSYHKAPWHHFTQTNFRYDPPDVWTEMMPDPSTEYLIGTATFALDDVAYMCGGRHPDAWPQADPNPEGLPPDDWWMYYYDKGPCTRDVRTYDGRTDTWAVGVAMPTSRPLATMSATSHDGVGYITGGHAVEPFEKFAEMFSYNPVTEAWTEELPCPSVNTAAPFKTLGDSGYLIYDVRASIEEYKFSEGSWATTHLNALPSGGTKTTDSACWTTPTHIALAGSVDSFDQLRTLWLCDGYTFTRGADHLGPSLLRSVMGASIAA